MICSKCLLPKKIRARGMCNTCLSTLYRKGEKLTKHERSDRAKLLSLQSNLFKAKPSKTKLPVGCKVREKGGIYPGEVITGTVFSAAADFQNPIFFMEGEEWVKVKMEKFGQVVPLRVSTLERVYTPVNEWDDPATNVEDDVAAIFAEVGA